MPYYSQPLLELPLPNPSKIIKRSIRWGRSLSVARLRGGSHCEPDQQASSSFRAWNFTTDSFVGTLSTRRERRPAQRLSDTIRSAATDRCREDRSPVRCVCILARRRYLILGRLLQAISEGFGCAFDAVWSLCCDASEVF